MNHLIDKLEQVSKDYRPIPFWSWNDKLSTDELRRQIGQMKDVGIGGFFMHARGGLETQYLSDEWFECIGACIDEAKKLGMNAWAYDENGWPSGFVGMKLLDDKENWVHYIEHKNNDFFDETALAVYSMKENELTRVFEQDHTSNEYLTVYEHTNSSVVDILNPTVVDKFIKQTHDEYYNRFKESFGNFMLGFFTDEPQYFRWATAYTPVMIEKYKEAYNEDILDKLGYLFYDHEEAFAFRYRYWKLMNSLFINNFIKRIYDWCNDHNCMITGHAVEESSLNMQMWCCAGIMPFYEYEHIPGIDWLGRNIGTELTPKQVSSVAAQLGKKQVLTETFACTGWDVTPKELKRIAEWQYVNGVNLMCQHLMSYSIRGQRKRDYPVSFSEHTPWFGDDFKYFNCYFTRLGYMLAESTEIVSVAVINPIHSAYLVYNRKLDYASTEKLEISLVKTIETLGAKQIYHHYIDETLLEKYGRVDGNKITIGNCSYAYIVLPQMLNLDSHTDKLLQQFIKNGGKICIDGNKPQYLDGKRNSFDYLESNITLDELKAVSPVKLDDDFTDIRSTLRKSDFGDFLYIVNLSDNKEYTVHAEIGYKNIVRFDIATFLIDPVYYTNNEDKMVMPLKLAAGESHLYFMDKGYASIYKSTDKQEIIAIDTVMNIVNISENALTLDYARLSFDGESYTELMPIPQIMDILIKNRTKQHIFLEYTFEIHEFVSEIYLESEKMNIVNVFLNSHEICLDLQGKKDKSFVRSDIHKNIQLGTNKLI